MKLTKVSNEIMEEKTMKNVEHFGDLTPRMNEFREKVLERSHIFVLKELY